jgi:hypothetical protein
MLRAALLTLMLASLAFVTFTPAASATCLDANPDDNGVGTQGCNLPAAGTCKVLAYSTVPGALWPSCLVITCVVECVPAVDDLWPPYDCVQDCDGPADS